VESFEAATAAKLPPTPLTNKHIYVIFNSALAIHDWLVEWHLPVI